ncbi:transposase [Fictibacillus nanhaiensis]|uniref:transposase n=1 Tax=Fictibacillus nanhaiensis TaxID=742169 RepID=UPI001C988AD4|nr:transposase [Fictibacillus nanhaiensis]MBY6036688.1 transposase [Fictibacillus nanhaiensis]
MKIFLIFGSILFPLFMFVLQRAWFKCRLFFNLAALLALLVFSNLISIGIYQIIKNKTVFMTNIHGLLLNPLFLLTGAYLGVYLLYRMVLLTADEQ